MCYLLLGNISALISDDCIEPLASARLRIYLPDYQHPGGNYPEKDIFNGPVQISPAAAGEKQERLLAETTLDEDGNFHLSWQQLHLFTEQLEVDLCLNRMPEQPLTHAFESHYHLSTLAPHWKRSRDSYVAAFAYVVPAESWSGIRASYGTWVIAGAVRNAHTGEGQPQLRVEAYNAANHRLLARAGTDDQGRYKLRFSRKDLAFNRQVAKPEGPDVYFKVYHNHRVLLDERAQPAHQPGHRAIAPCSIINLNVTVPPLAVGKAAGHMPGWLSSWVVGRRSSLVSY